MGSGSKVVQISNLERAVSTDINRLQSFAASVQSELARFTYDASTSELDAGGAEVMGAQVVGNPLRGAIVNGIRVRPEVGSTTCFVEPGVAYVMSPDEVPNPDDSAYKFIVDPGVQTAGILTLTPNSSGSTRFDIVECARNPTVALESDNRDVFNPSTGLFTATSVVKVQADRLRYRIRTGTPGGGFAGVGTALGWMPLAVCKVPNGTTNWDTVDLWDVRPLVSDLVRAPYQEGQAYPVFGKQLAWVNVPSAAIRLMAGVVETSYLGRKAGGVIPTTLFNLHSTDIVETGLMLVPGLWYVYAAFPFGLPRWARYSAAASGSRKPMGFRGLPVLSQKNPAGMTAISALELNMPVGLELGGRGPGVALISGMVVIDDITGSVMTDGQTLIKPFSLTVPPVLVIPGPGIASASYTFLPGTHFPPHATTVRVRFSVQVLGAPGTSFAHATILHGRDTTNTSDLWFDSRSQSASANSNGTAFTHSFIHEIPILFAGGVVMQPTPVRLTVSGSAATSFVFTPAAVIGWRVGA